MVKTMGKGRQVTILGKRMVINLNTRGGVRKSPGTNARSKCIAHHAKGSNFMQAAAKCKGTTGKNWSPGK